MKKKIIIVVSILVVAVVAFLGIFLADKKGKSVKDYDVLTLTNENEIINFIESQKIEKYAFDKAFVYVGGVDLFGEKAEIDFHMTNGNVSEVVAFYNLFNGYEVEEAENPEDVSDTVDIHEFTANDKKSIEEKFNDIKKCFEEFIGCTLDEYVIVPTCDKENIQDTDEAFYSGDFIKEFSIRDGNYVLWLVDYEASQGTASVTIRKIVDESNYEGFIPVIDMTKN